MTRIGASAFWLAIVLVATLLATPPLSATSLVPTVAAGSATIEIWSSGREGRLLAGLIAQFEAENPTVRVRLQVIPKQGAHEKLVTSAIGGTLPDLAHMNAPWVAEFATLGVLEPLNTFVASSGLDVRRFVPGVEAAFRRDGTWYGLPWYVGSHVVFYRRDHLRDAGFTEFPRTWSGFHDLCRRLKQQRPADYPLLAEYDDAGLFLALLAQNGGEVPGAVGFGGREGRAAVVGAKPTDGIGTPSPETAVTAAFAELSRWRSEGWAPWGATLPVSNVAGFTSGRYSMLIQGPWVVWALFEDAPQLKGQWATARLPGPGAGVSLLRPYGLSMFLGARNREWAWRLMEYLASPPAQVAFFKKAGNLPVHIDAWAAPELTGVGELQSFREQLDESWSAPCAVEWARVARAIGEVSDSLGHGRLTPTEATRQLDERLEQAKGSKAAASNQTQRLIVAMVLVNLPFVAFMWLLWQGEGIEWMSLAGQRLRRAMWFLAPALAIIFVFRIIPIGWSFFTSLTNWDVYCIADLERVSFVGFDNFVELWHDPVFWKSLLTTLLFLAMVAPLNIVLALTIALALHHTAARIQTILRVGFFLPVVTTLVAASLIWRWLFHAEYGGLPLVFGALGLPTVNWLEDPNLALFALVIVAVWKSFGYNMVIFLVARQGVDATLYEAAALDGAGDLQQCRHITLPAMTRSVTFAIVVTAIGALQVFTEPYVMTRGGPANSTLSLVMLLYREGFQNFRFGYASAIAVVLFALTLVLSLIRARFRRNFSEENAS